MFEIVSSFSVRHADYKIKRNTFWLKIVKIEERLNMLQGKQALFKLSDVEVSVTGHAVIDGVTLLTGIQNSAWLLMPLDSDVKQPCNCSL